MLCFLFVLKLEERHRRRFQAVGSREIFIHFCFNAEEKEGGAVKWQSC
jgi:hypothetical protein